MRINKKISSILCVYNEEKNIEKAIKEIFNQTYKNLEIIVVDNASTDKTLHLLEKTWKTLKAPKGWTRELKIVKNNNNIGLFKSRIEGLKLATGSYFTFFDADDSLSIDLYRTLINKAEETSSDIVICNVICNNIDINKYYISCSYLDSHFEWKNHEDIMNNFINLYMYNPEFIYVWNKLFSSSLKNKILNEVKFIDEKIIIYEDHITSTLAFYNASKVTNVTNEYYIYTYSPKKSGLNKDSKKIFKNLKNNSLDFAFVYKFLEKLYLNNKDLNKYIELFKNIRFYNYEGHANIIKNAKITNSRKRELLKILDFASEKPKKYLINNCWRNYKYFDNNIWDPKRKIFREDIDFISFDIFDTLVVRPFYKPADLFNLLSSECNRNIFKTNDYFDFAKVRIIAEKNARKKLPKIYEDLTIDEIYKEISDEHPFLNPYIDWIKEKEIQLEKEFCLTRRYGKELYDLALYLNKKILFISDMYLDKKTIINILIKNGYNVSDNLFLSSEIKKTKYTGNLYKHVIETLKINPKNISHIGDNKLSDVEIAKNLGINAIHLARTIDIFDNKYNELFFKNAINGFDLSNFNKWTIRIVYAIISNYMFDNPFIPYSLNSYFGNNFFNIGYMLIGPLLLSYTLWLTKLCEDTKCNNIVFASRDGYLFNESINIFNKYLNNDEIINAKYLVTSRSSFLPLLIGSKMDLFNLCNRFSNIWNLTYFYIIELLKPIIDEQEFLKLKKTKKLLDLELDKKIETNENWLKFCDIFMLKLFSKKQYENYSKVIKNYLKKYFDKEKTIFYDAFSSYSSPYVLKKKFNFNNIIYVGFSSSIASTDRVYSGNLETKYLYSLSPLMTFYSDLKEKLFNEINFSCLHWEISKDLKSINFIFDKENKYNFFEEETIRRIQSGSLFLVQEFISIYKKYYKNLITDYVYLCYPFEYFLESKKFNSDLDFLKFYSCLDPFNNLGKENLLEWKIDIDNYWPQKKNNYNINSYSKIKRIIFYLLYDFYQFRYLVYQRFKRNKFIMFFLKRMNNFYLRVIKKKY